MSQSEKNKEVLLKKYLQGTISAEELHQLNLLALEDDFLFEALEGLALNEKQNLRNINELKNRFNKKRYKQKPLLYLISSAAAVALILLISNFIFDFGFTTKDGNEIAINTEIDVNTEEVGSTPKVENNSLETSEAIGELENISENLPSSSESIGKNKVSDKEAFSGYENDLDETVVLETSSASEFEDVVPSTSISEEAVLESQHLAPMVQPKNIKNEDFKEEGIPSLEQSRIIPTQVEAETEIMRTKMLATTIDSLSHVQEAKNMLAKRRTTPTKRDRVEQIEVPFSGIMDKPIYDHTIELEAPKAFKETKTELDTLIVKFTIIEKVLSKFDVLDSVGFGCEEKAYENILRRKDWPNGENIVRYIFKNKNE